MKWRIRKAWHAFLNHRLSFRGARNKAHTTTQAKIEWSKLTQEEKLAFAE